MKLTEMQIDAANEWWGKAYKNPRFQTLRPGDTSKGSQPAAMAELMAAAGRQTPDNDSIAKFKEALRVKLQSNDEIMLSVDYNPSRDLGECLEKAGGIQGTTALPWKSTMLFENGGVQVSCGYGEPYVELLAN